MGIYYIVGKVVLILKEPTNRVGRIRENFKIKINTLQSPSRDSSTLQTHVDIELIFSRAPAYTFVVVV